MAEAVVGGGSSKMPQSFGEKLAFSVPVIIVTFLLSVAVAVGVTIYVDGKTRDELNSKIGEVDKKVNNLKDDLTATKGKLAAAEDKIAALQKDTSKLAEETKTLKGEQEKTDLAMGEFRVKFVKQEEVNSEVKGTAMEHSKNLAEHASKIKYIEDKLVKLDAIANDVESLKGDTAGLKQEYAVLKGDLNAVRNKADVTEKDLIELGDRARQFQMRVLLARAREASEAARSSDMQTLLRRLEDVEGGK
jgi:predicted nuclease with TOPRIM domain